ncbi:MAG: hypothetical protein WBV55_17075 [Candidatus Sulfotelmatobacter sp.]
MENIVGIFHSIGPAMQAVRDLISRGIPENAIVFVSKEAFQKGENRAVPEKALDEVRTTGSEPTGGGKTMGSVLGAFAGGSAGLAGGAAVASLMVPGLGLITAIGLGAAAALGLGGAAAGAKVGDVIERTADTGASKNQVQFYHELLRSGHSLVLADVRSGQEISTVREVFRQNGSEDVETARRELGKAA